MRGLAAILLCLAAVGEAHAADAIWDALRLPGTVVIMRHSYAPGTFDPPTARLEDCTTQRNLDETGKAQARRVGAEFRRHGIVVGTILSSPRCRCLDTARLAFREPEPWEVLQGALNDDARRQQQLLVIRRRIAGHASGAPLVLVTHGSVVTDLTGVNIPMGGFVVMRRTSDGRHEVVGDLFLE